jgi:glycosyltransferase involved in cell wall biosynthesis
MIRSPSIRLLHRQSPAGLDALYRASDVFVMPSLIEGFGLVYLEALARGCHVIGTANTGLPDLNLSAKAATLVEAGDLHALAAALASGRDAALAGRLDKIAIAAAAAAWSWPDFRKAIAQHAAAMIDA